jgi:alpha-glucosidase
MMPTVRPDTPWWQRTAIYQIYPRSFSDSNGDGIGDLPGITSKLDYVQDLGFETIWISPFYPSPQADHGYDISDYHGVAPEYGTMADCEQLIEETHRRGMRLLLDLVLNHTSDQHPWFLESRSSRTNPKAGWYIWRDGAGTPDGGNPHGGNPHGGKPPNNWRAMPGGRCWHYAAERDQWFLASFMPFQPDLNWRNPEVKRAMFDVVRYWLGKGVDGFRLDMFSTIMKDDRFRDNPFHPGIHAGAAPGLHRPSMQLNHPDTFPFAKELRQVVREFGDPERVLLGEVFGTKAEHRGVLGGDTNDGLNLVFIFDFIFLLRWQRTARWFARVVRSFEHHFPAPFQPTYVFGNHDQRRLMSKIGEDAGLARVLATFQLTVRGVPTVYMGEEIGMTDVQIPRTQAQDPVSKLYGWVPDVVRQWLPVNLNRDNNRTPMQWTAGAHAGFCSAQARPWLPVAAHNRHECNVEGQQGDTGSLLNLYRALLHLRRESAALSAGTLTPLDTLPPTVLGYVRQLREEAITVLLNFGTAPVEITLPAPRTILLATDPRCACDGRRAQLVAKSGIVLR